MRITLKEFRARIRSVLSEIDDSSRTEKKWIPATKHSPGRWEIVDKPDKREVDVAPPSQRMSHVQRFEKDAEAWIEHMSRMPEFEKLSTFKESKIDDEDYEFDFMELNALTRSLWRSMTGEENSVPPYDFFKNVKKDLIDFGLEFKPRKILKLPRSGHSSHGTHPFAGAGGGGSGFGVDGTPGGRGPGNVGGKRSWDPGGKDLPMGAGKLRREGLSLRRAILESVCERCGYDNPFADDHPYICRQCRIRAEKWGDPIKAEEPVPSTERFGEADLPCPECGRTFEQGHAPGCDYNDEGPPSTLKM